MSTVVMHAVVSVDGFIADAGDEVGPLFEWYFNGDAEIVDGGPFKVSEASIGYVRPMWERIGTTVIGRHLFDLTNGWDGIQPAAWFCTHSRTVNIRTGDKPSSRGGSYGRRQCQRDQGH